MTRVPVYIHNPGEVGLWGNEIIARVQYTSNLDYWDGGNWTNGGVGRHKGITKLRDGRYVIINGTQWQGERDYAYVVSDREALEAILSSGNEQLLKEGRFKSLRALEKLVRECQ
ncbi:hypothetical protein [Paenibacillus campinasensis]|uniref:Uncharacterized protein n=1 Tax=Paenibacillus campinasensis TaxID=66347 RepID=A0A268EIC1_9BACL|nr:hypothetical protein [Paenibacillus campinasensis]PAD72865.1 hypothetical protein CHH67_21400 [Paenibacillus campinasensis]